MLHQDDTESKLLNRLQQFTSERTRGKFV